MTAIVFGLATAGFWAVTTLASARASRAIGASATLALVMVIGLLVALPAILLTGPLPQLGPREVALLAIAGGGNVFGLLLQYRGVRTGQVGVVATIVSTEGAITALIAIALGEPVVAGVGVALVVVATGATLAASGPTPTGGEHSSPAERTARARRAAAYATAAAVVFGISLYAIGRIGTELPVAWAILPARLVGTLVVALPLGLRGRLRADRRSVPAIVITALAEVAGVVAFALGARSSIAVTAVLASQFAVIAAVAAFVLFRERLAPRQWLGVGTTAFGVAVLGALRV